MKKILIAMLVGVFASGLTYAQGQQITPGTNKTISVAGDYNSSALGAGTTRSWTPINYSYTAFPLYTKTNTVTNTGTDTFRGKIIGEQNSVYVWSHVNPISGTNTSCTIKLWVSADSGRGVDFKLVQTYTVSATNPISADLINSTSGGWPFSNWMLTYGGVGTQVSTWYSGVMVRFKEEMQYADNKRNRLTANRHHKYWDDEYIPLE
jgi:hypothetical protein